MRKPTKDEIRSRPGQSGMISAGKRWVRENKEILKFCLVFGLTLGAFALILQTDIVQGHLVTPHLEQVAALCGAILNAFGTQCEVSGSAINAARFSVSVVRGCDSIYPTAMLWAALLAYSATWKSRLIGLLGGAVVLFLLNIVRILTMFYIGSYFPSLFDIVHVYAWQALFILITLAVWLFWAAKISRAKTPVSL
jgi:exosortase H (IPTLxxWG-CTERM-specific)